MSRPSTCQLALSILVGISLTGAIAMVALHPGFENFDTKQPQASDDMELWFRDHWRPDATLDLPTVQYKKILGADEIVYKLIKGNPDFELYVAQWKAGNPFVYQSTEHPPDLCWAESGWRCIEAKSTTALPTLTGVTLAPAEWRLFSSPIGRQEVAFWCIEGKRALALGYRGSISREGLRILSGSEFLRRSIVSLREILIGGEARRKVDVYFVRINTRSSLADVLISQNFNQLNPLLRKVGVLTEQP